MFSLIFVDPLIFGKLFTYHQHHHQLSGKVVFGPALCFQCRTEECKLLDKPSVEQPLLEMTFLSEF